MALAPEISTHMTRRTCPLLCILLVLLLPAASHSLEHTVVPPSPAHTQASAPATCNQSSNSNITCCIPEADGSLLCGSEVFEPREVSLDPGGFMFYLYVAAALFLTLTAGMMSGLTLGLLSLDPINLQIVINSGQQPDAKYAGRILKLIGNHHLLLVTLLLANAMAMEALPLVIDRLLSPLGAILISVTMVLFFGEIIPQALCSRFGLAIGGTLFWLVWGVVGLLFVVSWPISKVLDLVLGKSHKSMYMRRHELTELIKMHGNSGGGVLASGEVDMIKGVLELMSKNVSAVMTPIDVVFMVSIDASIDQETVNSILQKGFSRVPVYVGSRDKIVGMLLVKSLICLLLQRDSRPVRVSELQLHYVPPMAENMSLYAALKIFQKGKSHMAIVVDPAQRRGEQHSSDSSAPVSRVVLGILTLEDVIQELIQDTIAGEHDFGAHNISRFGGGSSVPVSNIALAPTGPQPAPGEPGGVPLKVLLGHEADDAQVSDSISRGFKSFPTSRLEQNDAPSAASSGSSAVAAAASGSGSHAHAHGSTGFSARAGSPTMFGGGGGGANGSRHASPGRRSAELVQLDDDISDVDTGPILQALDDSSPV